MLCVQCGTDNPEGTKFCVSCNAVLPMQPLASSSSMDIAENVEYLVPEAHYQSPVLQQLAWTVHDFIEEEAELEPVIEAYEAFREIFEGFKEEIPKIRDICLSQQGVLDEDMVPAQLKFLIDRAEELYVEGEQQFEGWLDALEDLEEDEDFPDPQSLIEGTKKWLSCNDMICMTFDILVGREKDLKELSQDLETLIQIKTKEEADAARAAQSGEKPAAPSPEASSPPLIPSDSTDLA